MVAGPAGPLRVALLPSGWQALSLIGAMVGADLGLAHHGRLGRRRRGRAITDDDADVTRPLIATGVLVLPFLPVAPDVWPALTVLAGRFALRRLVRGRRRLRCGRPSSAIRAARRAHTTLVPAAAAASVLVAASLLYGGVAWRFAGTGLFPGGDEPHYLVLAQSLWRDHDFKIENNHARGDTLEYYRLPLAAALSRARHATARSTRSIPVGLAIVAAPIYAAGGYYARRRLPRLCAAGAAARLVAGGAAADRIGAARRRWPGSAPRSARRSSSTASPSIRRCRRPRARWPAYLIATRRGGHRRPSRAARAPAGWCWRCLPWLSSKYALMMAAIADARAGAALAPDAATATPIRTRPPAAAPPGRLPVACAIG